MKNRLLSVALVLLVLVNLTACGSNPDGGNDPAASCDHQWIEATCIEPKTCSKCGTTEGDPLGHDFAPATVDSPKKCKICGFEEGEKIRITEVNMPDDSWWDYDYTNDAILNCKYTDEVDGGCLHYYYYDFDLNPVYDGYLVFPDSIGKYHSCIFDLSQGLFYWLTMDVNKAFLEVYKVNKNGFEQIYRSEVPGSYQNNDNLAYSIILESKKYHMASFMGYTFVYDIENNRLCSEEDIKDEEVIKYDKTLYSHFIKVSQIDGYFVGSKDGSSWGYLDKDGNEIAMYADATNFNYNGYALISEDGTTYSIIDKDFNIVGDGLFKGAGAYLTQEKSNCFFVVQADGTSTLVKIE